MKSEKNASAPVRNRISVTGSKKFLDKVFAGNCGEVVAQYSSHNGIDPKISSLQSNYNLV